MSMPSSNGYNAYRQNSILNASPEDSVVMLYNGLIRFMLQAQTAISEKDPAKAHDNIIRAEKIISYFMVTLDHQYEIANTLEQLYDYMHRRLVEANLKKDGEILAEILNLVTQLRDAWAQASKNCKQNPAGLQQIK